MKFMLSLQLKRVYLYIFGAILLGFAFAIMLGAIHSPQKAKAGGYSASCTVYVYDNGPLSIYAIMYITQNNVSSLINGWDGVYSPWVPYITSWNTYYYHTYSSGGSKTVYGRFSYVGSGSNVVNEAQCSRTFNVPQPNSQALAWVTDINCSATTGALTFTATVRDDDGGTPGYYLSIQNIGDTGWIYKPNGSYGHGPWYPPRNGATYSISIWAADAQTGTQVGPAVYYYSCPSPPPPPTCSLSVSPALVGPGDPSTLSWSSANATSLTVDQGVGPLSPVASGSKPVYPGVSTKTYTGTVTNSVGATANCSTTLNVGAVACSLNSILAIEPGETYQPRVTISYVGGAATFSATTTVTVTSFAPNVNTISPTPVAGNTTYSSVAIGSPILMNTPGNYTVTSLMSGTVNGAPYAPIDCTGGSIPLPYVPVVRKPYFKVFGGGLTVGAGFNNGTTTCIAPASGQVSAFASNTPSFHGASTQYDLKALSSVATTFYSSGGRQPATPNYKALTFANNAASGTYGGGIGGTSCITDYYTTTRNATMPTVSGPETIGSLDSAAVNDQVDWSGGTLNGSAPTILAAGGKLVVYVTGDVYIANNITLATSYNNVSDIPFFALVVKGNIMIAPSVTTLDGLYIAQPQDDGSGGGIYTCATSTTTIPASTELYDTCQTKLTFNGSVVARTLKLLRTNSTLNQAVANETSSSIYIAEVFNGMPELFIANPAFKVDDTATELYDSITSLPPLL